MTSNGKPVAVLTLAEEDNLEDVLATLRQGRAQAAVAHLRQAAVTRGLDALTDETIQDVIRKTRREGRKAASGGSIEDCLGYQRPGIRSSSSRKSSQPSN